jgi:hypothetical protein
MYQYPIRSHIAFKVLRVVLRQARRVMRLLLRRPVIDVLFVMLVLYLLATLIGGVNQPRPFLRPTPPILFEGR